MLKTVPHVIYSLCLFVLLPSGPIVAQESSVASNTDVIANITLLSGKSLEGRVLKLDQGSITIAPPNGNGSQGKQYAIEDIERITLDSVAAGNETPGFLLRLVDGSLLALEDFTITDRVANVSLINGETALPLKITTRDIDWLRLEMSSLIDDAWQTATKTPPASDTLFLLKDSELEPLEGIIQNVSDELLDFKFDGSVIQAKRSKISGMLFYHAAGRELPAAIALCHDRFGSKLMVQSFRLEDAKQDQPAFVRLELVSGGQVSLPVSSLATLDFTVGKVLYLSDLPVDGMQWSPQIDAGPLQKPLAKLLTWNKDLNLSGKPLKLFSAEGFNGDTDSYTQHEKEFARGIAVRSGTKLVYQIPQGFQTLNGICGIDPLVRPQGNVVLEFSSEGKSLWSREISGSADSPETIEFDIQNVRRLILHVDYGKHSDVADHLNICNLRLMK